jgi:hypothetical protein
MAYVQNALLPGEIVVHTGRVHWALLLPGMVSMFFGVAILGAPKFVPAFQHPALAMFVWLGGGFFVASGLLHLIGAAIKRMTTELALTNKRVISRAGLIRREIIEIFYAKIENVVVDQSILGMVLGYGSLWIDGVGGHRNGIHDIENPMAFRQQLVAMMDPAMQQQK